LRRFRHSPADVYEPDPNSIVVHNDREVATRDGTILRVNVSLPATGGPFRAIAVVIAGRWLWPRNPLTGPDHDARLLVPMIPR
jgi:hypothetical protein